MTQGSAEVRPSPEEIQVSLIASPDFDDPWLLQQQAAALIQGNPDIIAVQQYGGSPDNLEAVAGYLTTLLDREPPNRPRIDWMADLYSAYPEIHSAVRVVRLMPALPTTRVQIVGPLDASPVLNAYYDDMGDRRVLARMVGERAPLAKLQAAQYKELVTRAVWYTLQDHALATQLAQLATSTRDSSTTGDLGQVGSGSEHPTLAVLHDPELRIHQHLSVLGIRSSIQNIGHEPNDPEQATARLVQLHTQGRPGSEDVTIPEQFIAPVDALVLHALIRRYVLSQEHYRPCNVQELREAQAAAVALQAGMAQDQVTAALEDYDKARQRGVSHDNRVRAVASSLLEHVGTLLEC